VDVSERDDCPDENEIVGFLEGALSAADQARIEAHCARCARCREGLAHAAYDATAGALGSPGALLAAVERLQRRLAGRRRRVGLAVAGAVVVAAEAR
jgi:anti-sigma factor RsiW